MLVINKITAHHTVDFAAEELKKYLRMMMPRCGEIDIFYAPNASNGFRLGLMSDFGLDTSEAEDLALDDILHIETDENGGILAGSNPRSVLLAVYRYLTENGCRWLFPGVDGELIPTKEIVPIAYHKMADSRSRGQCNEGAEFQQSMLEAIDFTPKLGMNVFMLEFDNPKAYYDYYYNRTFNEGNRDCEPVTAETTLQWKRACEAEIAKRGLQLHDMGHGWTAEPYGIDSTLGWQVDKNLKVPEESREFIAMVNGKREIFKGIPLDSNICMSNPRARALWVRAVADYAERNTNVDYLHVWLADCHNNHCECESCRKKTPSDWYIMLMNEIDEALTVRNLDTRIVFICYYETVWVAETENIKNPKRFSMLFAPITRVYYQSVPARITEEHSPIPFVLNDIQLPKTIDEYITYGKKAFEAYGVSSFVYEYHFWYHQYFNPGSMRYARMIHEDVKGYRANGFGGLIEDGSQRSFFPNGFCQYVYAATLFDLSVNFDDLKEDYFRHAYGECWQEVLSFMERIGNYVPQKYLAGKASRDESVSLLYDPSMEEGLRGLAEAAEKFVPFVDANRNQRYRPQSVMMRILKRYLEFWRGIAECFALKCTGTHEKEAYLKFHEFFASFGAYEVEIERYYDHYMVGYGYVNRYFDPAKGLPEQ